LKRADTSLRKLKTLLGQVSRDLGGAWLAATALQDVFARRAKGHHQPACARGAFPHAGNVLDRAYGGPPPGSGSKPPARSIGHANQAPSVVEPVIGSLKDDGRMGRN